MSTRGESRLDAGVLASPGKAREIEIIVPYTEREIAAKVLKKTVELAAGLSARISLIAVHAVPYPVPFCCPTAPHAHLVHRVVDLAADCSLPVSAHVVLARSQEEGFCGAIPAESVVLIGTRKRLLRTYEERLARMLAAQGHKVSLIRVE